MVIVTLSSKRDLESEIKTLNIGEYEKQNPKFSERRDKVHKQRGISISPAVGRSKSFKFSKKKKVK